MITGPQGTISRTLYDTQMRPISTWVGTDDNTISGTSVAALANSDGSTTPFAAQSQTFTIVAPHRATSHAIRFGHAG